MRVRDVFLTSLLAAVLLTPPRSGAGELIVFEDFEKFDLKQLPAGWIPTSAGDFSIVDEPGHGKVLKISHKGGGRPSLAVALDPAKVRGHVVRIAALAKFPGVFTSIADKAWACPKIMLQFKDKDGGDHYCGRDIEAGRTDWQSVFNHTTIDKEANSIGAYLRIELVAAEVFFDDFSVELDPDLNAPPPKSKGAHGTTPTAGGTSPAGGTAAGGNAAAAAKAPKRDLEQGGAFFGPEMAAALQKAIKPGAANTYAAIGPGLPMREFEGKAPEKWTRAPLGKEAVGAALLPRNLLATLPDFIVKSKPEVVFLVGEVTTTRKLSMLESLDWEDLARLCLRLGAVPVLAVPPAAPVKDGPVGLQDDLRSAMVRAATEANCPAIDMKNLQLLPRLEAQMLGLLDKHVFCRSPLDQPGSVPTPGKKVEEE